MHATSMILIFSVLVCAAHGPALSQQLIRESKVSPIPDHILEHFVKVIPSVERIDLKPVREVKREPWGILSSIAVIDVRVGSSIPMWGALVDIGPVTGTSGNLSRDKIWIKTEGTGDVSVPFAEPVSIASDDGPIPMRNTSVEFEVRPDWSDVPGEYSGLLTFTPMVREEGVPFLMEQAFGGEEQIHKRTRPPRIEIHMCIPEVIVLTLSSTELEFNGVAGPGTYTADKDIRFKVFTNSMNWAVLCEATDLKSDRGKLPPERIRWERVRRDGRIEETGTLVEKPCVVKSRRVLPEDEILLRFSIEVTMDDVAGNYNGTITLKGVVEQ